METDEGHYDKRMQHPGKILLGNHDIWWNENDKGQTLYCKKYSMDQLQLTRPYYSMQKNDWNVIVLDRVRLNVEDIWYIGRFGDEQFNRLKQELKKHRQHYPSTHLITYPDTYSYEPDPR
ncbi:hypothetical protein NAF17_04645 [Mucilaginibacter sp. RB4R14]|uniref:hypothetical protein n=1 Tax=Mucilaginibacter aurantiaciroseus TaxID=2949308 RepID=UPI0020911B44|nr:hypothetical protein [Mucilaginibacter aurantiaciroseus]MCO5934820.1 hypothetical protein [Mucilaginibacter aurantiaciroseus]